MITKLLSRMLALFMSPYACNRLRDFLMEIRNDHIARMGLRKAGKMEFPRPCRLNIGCGPNVKEGWVNIDLAPSADLRIDVRRRMPFPDASCEVVYAEHFFEHLVYPDESIPFLRECFRVLQNRGVIHIGVPDSRYVVESCMKDPVDPEFLKRAGDPTWCYPAYCRTGFEFINFHFRLGGDHKYAYDFATLKAHLESVGFCNVREREPDPRLDTESRADGSLYVTAQKTADH